MGTRLELHQELLSLAPHAYHQPPATVRMSYPCFRYDLSDIETWHADNRSYRNLNHYSLTYISKEPAEDKAHEILEHFKYCRFDRHYTADNLHHYTFELYY